LSRPPRPAPSEGEINISVRREAWQERNLGAANRAICERDAEAFVHQSVSSPCLTTVKRAEGIWVEDFDGRRYMDFHGNSVHHIGYGHPRLKAAIAQQMEELPFAPRRFASEVALELAETLGALAPGDLGKVLFTTGGSDAIEVALKIARTASGRFKTLSFWDAFHGAGFGAAGVGGEQLFRSSRIGPLLPGAEHVAPFACYRCPYGYPDLAAQPGYETCQVACANYLSYVLDKEGDVAAVVAETIRAVPYLPPPGFWKAVREACARNGTLLIFDVTPDILVLGKALGGGILPIAAAICRPDLDRAPDLALGHYTHEKNPVTAQAALTTIRIIQEEGLVERAAELGAKALLRLSEMAARLPVVGDVRGRGLLMGVELVEDRESKSPAGDLAEAVYYRALDAGLSLKITMGNVLTLSPPLVIDEADLMRGLEIVEQAIEGACCERL
jgi:4-aminobutyrate aminotransferase